MAIAATSSISLLFFLLNLCLRGTYGDYGGGWQGGHATFYGGGDASGTMGKFKQIPCLFIWAYKGLKGKRTYCCGSFNRVTRAF